jgi:ABC-type Mn2+/Zn2+ transport system permease subunit
LPLIEYLRYPIFQRALVASIVAGGTFSLLGTVVVTLNLTTIRFALMHMALLGAACSLALNQQPVVGAVVAIVVGSLLLGPLSDRMKMDAGLTSALFMTGSIAAAFILFYRARVPAMEAFGLFTGSVLAMTETETWVILIVGAVVLAVFVALYREIQLVLYDRELAKLLGVPAEAVRNGLLVLTGLAIGLAMRIVGALLVDAVMLLPALGAMMIGKSLAQVLVVCSVLGILSASGGLLLSMAVDLPSGASMTVVAVMALVVVATIKSILVQRRGVRDE